MNLSCHIVLVVLVLGQFSFAVTVWKAYATVPQLVRSAGYPIQKHNVYTSDGYILQLYRIPNGLDKNATSATRKAVLLVHGFLCSCDNFIIMGANKSIAFLLADAGYDVWLANLRGNLYTSHRHLTRSDPTFWDYSFEEHGKLDAPAIIDKVLQETGLSRLLYVGHSMGCTTFLTMLAQRPEYNEKLVAFVGLAPAGYMDNMRGLVNFLINKLDLYNFLNKRNIRGLAASRNALELLSDYCMAQQTDTDLCLKLIYYIVGDHYAQLFPEFEKIFIMRTQPASTRQMLHFAKIALSSVFTYWEDGFRGRIRAYNLSNIKTPVSLWYGINDQLTEMTQIQRLARELNDTGTLHSITAVPSCEKFNHLDFIYAKDVGTLLNIPLVSHIKDLFNKYDK